MDKRRGGAYLPLMFDHALIDDRRAVLSVTGPDARELLQGVVTQDMGGVSKDHAAYSLLLTPQGKILFDFFLTEGPEGEILVDAPAAQAEDLFKRLKLYKLRAKAEIADRPEFSVLLAWSGDAPAPPGFVIERSADRIVYTDPRLDALGARAIVRRSEREAALSALGAPATHQAHAEHRIALGVPESPIDIVPGDTFPLDANLDALRGVDYKKGCFVGQEVASRMKRKGEVRKRMLTISFDGPPPEAGDAVMAGETTLGEVRSIGAGKALALIRMDRLYKAIEDGRPPAVNGRPVSAAEPAYLV
ncbi:MAG: folate-binding protein [Pseudomonadota bacterium]